MNMITGTAKHYHFRRQQGFQCRKWALPGILLMLSLPGIILPASTARAAQEFLPRFEQHSCFTCAEKCPGLTPCSQKSNSPGASHKQESIHPAPIPSTVRTTQWTGIPIHRKKPSLPTSINKDAPPQTLEEFLLALKDFMQDPWSYGGDDFIEYISGTRRQDWEKHEYKEGDFRVTFPAQHVFIKAPLSFWVTFNRQRSVEKFSLKLGDEGHQAYSGPVITPKNILKIFGKPRKVIVDRGGELSRAFALYYRYRTPKCFAAFSFYSKKFIQQMHPQTEAEKQRVNDYLKQTDNPAAIPIYRIDVHCSPYPEIKAYNLQKVTAVSQILKE